MAKKNITLDKLIEWANLRARWYDWKRDEKNCLMCYQAVSALEELRALKNDAK